MLIRTSLALRALRTARWGVAAACGAVTVPIALAAGGPSAAVPAATTVTLATALATGVRRTGRAAGLAGIARSWARAHPWRFALIPAAALTAALLILDAATGWPTPGAALAGLAVLITPRMVRRSRAHDPVRAAAVTGRRLVRAHGHPALPRPRAAERQLVDEVRG